MAASSVSVLAVGVTLTAAATQFRGVQLTGAAVTAAGNGYIAQTAGNIGDRISATVLGTAIAEAGAAIAANALVEFDSSGRVVTKSAGVAVGRVAPGYTASQAGDLVEIIVLPN
jgi:hypothetical protein